MPPFLPRKRLASTPPPPSPAQSNKKVKTGNISRTAVTKILPDLKRNKTFSLGSDDSDSSLSEIDSDEFEEVKPTRSQLAKTAKPVEVANDKSENKDDDEDEDEDEEIEWEDAAAQEDESLVTTTAHTPLAGGDIELTFRKDDEDIPQYGLGDAAKSSRKGPSKREKEVRITTHQIHVQFLLWHNTIRNSWVCDKEVQKTLVQQLPTQIKTQVDRWRKASGLVTDKNEPPRQYRKKKGKQKSGSGKGERDWSRRNQRLEVGKADLSRGDPLISLLRVLSAYWKKRFAIVAPGLRKRGYETKQGLKKLITAYRTEEHDPEKFGEKIVSLQEFRQLAKKCEGSRDVGAQLFTALLRGLGIEARLVASLQPAGYGWTKAEQPAPFRVTKSASMDSSSESDSDGVSIPGLSRSSKQNGKKNQVVKSKNKGRSRKGDENAPIELDSDEGSIAKIQNVENDDNSGSDSDSIVDITPFLPKQRRQRYDRDVPFPIYWTEAISPITNKVHPVSALVIQNPVATAPEILASFEPRGQWAEKAKIVMAYVVAYSSDGTAKDVTTRYLKKQVWPGKTKGFRLPVEKVPIYNTHGKIKRYEEYDWFKTVMSPYTRTHAMRTAVDDVEDSTDLVRKEPEKKKDDTEVDTLQSLKASADFVLERHLRREEAVRPGSKPDRYFISGKGDNIKEEPIYKRNDVERCLTAESWRREGREPKVGEIPMKLVPVRAVTLIRKREAEEHERQTGQKQMQGLYSWDQTEYIIPPPIQDGVIPKNAYGTLDCFVPSMVPQGAVHVPLKGTVRICKKLEIDFAEAVTGFEFGNKRAVPVCTGVVVARENERMLREAWRQFNEEQRKKEESKMEKLVLDLWRKFVTGLRIRERLAETYTDRQEEELPDSANAGKEGTFNDPIELDDDMQHDPEAGSQGGFAEEDMAGGFLLPHEDDVSEHEDLVLEQHDSEAETGFSSTSHRDLKAMRKPVTTSCPTPTSISPPKNTKFNNPQNSSVHLNAGLDSYDDMDIDLVDRSKSSQSSEMETDATDGEEGSEQDEDSDAREIRETIRLGRKSLNLAARSKTQLQNPRLTGLESHQTESKPRSKPASKHSSEKMSYSSKTRKKPRADNDTAEVPSSSTAAHNRRHSARTSSINYREMDSDDSALNDSDSTREDFEGFVSDLDSETEFESTINNHKGKSMLNNGRRQKNLVINLPSTLSSSNKDSLSFGNEHDHRRTEGETDEDGEDGTGNEAQSEQQSTNQSNPKSQPSTRIRGRKSKPNQNDEHDNQYLPPTTAAAETATSKRHDRKGKNSQMTSELPTTSITAVVSSVTSTPKRKQKEKRTTKLTSPYF